MNVNKAQKKRKKKICRNKNKMKQERGRDSGLKDAKPPHRSTSASESFEKRPRQQNGVYVREIRINAFPISSGKGFEANEDWGFTWRVSVSRGPLVDPGKVVRLQGQYLLKYGKYGEYDESRVNYTDLCTRNIIRSFTVFCCLPTIKMWLKEDAYKDATCYVCVYVSINSYSVHRRG